MKTKFISLALIAIVIFFSCRKSYDTSVADSEPASSKTFSVKDAKIYLDTALHLKGSSLNGMVLNSTRHLSSNAYFMFSRAKVGSIKHFDVVEIPVALINNVIPFYNFAKDSLKYRPDMSVFHASFTRMLVYRDQLSNTVKSVSVTYIPDKEYLMANKNDASNNTIAKMSPSFKGYLQYQDKDGNLKYVLRIVNGKVVRKYANSPLGRLAVQSTKQKVNDWVEQCVEHWQVGCQLGPEGELINCGEPVMTGQDCTVWYEPDDPNNDPTPPDDGGGSGGGGGGDTGSGDNVDITVPNVEPAESDYELTCPDNFSFSSTTSSNLWQEGRLTNIYCTLGVIDLSTGLLTNVRAVELPQVYFGLPYYNVEGNLLYTQNQAKAIAADALNLAEYDMRQKYKSDTDLTSAQLANFWVARMNYYMGNYTNNHGRVGRTGSINPANTPPSRAYHPCY